MYRRCLNILTGMHVPGGVQNTETALLFCAVLTTGAGYAEFHNGGGYNPTKNSHRNKQSLTHTQCRCAVSLIFNWK